MPLVNIILISGPTGSGKSTFIQNILEGRVHQDIYAQLPDGCGSWPVIESNNVLKGTISNNEILRKSMDCGGIILHYDITFIDRHAADDFCMDPVMTLIDQAGHVDIVFIRPDKKQLIEQFRKRLEQIRNKKSWYSMLWAKYLRNPIRRITSTIKGTPYVTPDHIYSDTSYIDMVYQKWEAYINNLKHKRNIIYLTPNTNHDGEKYFKLIESKSAQNLNKDTNARPICSE